MACSHKFSEYEPEISAFKKDGYEIVEKSIEDYGQSLSMLVKKDNKFSKVYIRRVFLDENGEVCGILDIRDSQWSRKIRGTTS